MRRRRWHGGKLRHRRRGIFNLLEHLPAAVSGERQAQAAAYRAIVQWRLLNDDDSRTRCQLADFVRIKLRALTHYRALLASDDMGRWDHHGSQNGEKFLYPFVESLPKVCPLFFDR